MVFLEDAVAIVERIHHIEERAADERETRGAADLAPAAEGGVVGFADAQHEVVAQRFGGREFFQQIVAEQDAVDEVGVALHAAEPCGAAECSQEK